MSLYIKLSLLLILALNTQFVMDEFWLFGLSKYLGNGIYDTIWPSKPLGSTVFYKLAYWLGWDAVSTILVGRLQTVFLAFGTLALLFAIARSLGQNWLQAMLVVLLALSFSTFIERVFRIRADPLALFFATAALYWIVSRDTQHLKTVLIAGCLSGLSFLATQKAVYFNVSLGLGLIIEALSRREIRVALSRGAVLVTGWAIPVILYCVVFGGWDPLAIFVSFFRGSVEKVTSGHGIYTGKHTFYMQTVGRNVLPYLLCSCGLLISLFKWRALMPAQKITMVFTLVMIACMGVYYPPWPYVFILLIPFLSLWAPTTLDVSRKHKRWSIWVNMIWAVAIILSFVRNVYYIQNDNRAALEIIRYSEKLLDPDETYFDGIGMLPNFKAYPRGSLDKKAIHIANSKGELSGVMEKLRAAPPYLIIDSYRTKNIGDLLQPFLERSYIRIAPNIRVPGIFLSDTREVRFNVPLRQEFGVFDKTGKPVQMNLLVEGEPFQTPVLLKPGSIDIGLEAGANRPLFLLPANKAYSAIQPESTPIQIFKGVYTY